jgi:hypothetical protein
MAVLHQSLLSEWYSLLEKSFHLRPAELNHDEEVEYLTLSACPFVANAIGCGRKKDRELETLALTSFGPYYGLTTTFLRNFCQIHSERWTMW